MIPLRLYVNLGPNNLSVSGVIVRLNCAKMDLEYSNDP